MRVSYIICMDRGRKSLVDTLYTVVITRYVKTYLLGEKIRLTSYMHVLKKLNSHYFPLFLESTELRRYFCTLVEKTRRTSHTCSNGRTRLRVRIILDSGLQSSRYFIYGCRENRDFHVRSHFVKLGVLSSLFWREFHWILSKNPTECRFCIFLLSKPFADSH